MTSFRYCFVLSFIVGTLCVPGLGDPSDSQVLFCQNTNRLLGEARAAERAQVATRLEKKRDALAGFARKVARQKESGVREEHLPYFLQNKDPNAPVVVLVHGIGESPKGMRQIAEEYQACGYSVLTVLLDGHGSKPEDLALFDVPDWQKEIDDNLRLAQSLGSRVDLAGYSVGGMLAADAKLRNPELSHKLILHSPAFALAADRQKKVLGSADAGEPWTADIPSTAYGGFDGYRYAQTSAPAFARVLRFGEKMRQRWEEQQIITPVYLIEASNDRMADAQAIENFASSQGVPARRRLVVRGPHARTVQAGEGSSAPELQAFLHGLNN